MYRLHCTSAPYKAHSHLQPRLQKKWRYSIEGKEISMQNDAEHKGRPNNAPQIEINHKCRSRFIMQFNSPQLCYIWFDEMHDKQDTELQRCDCSTLWRLQNHLAGDSAKSISPLSIALFDKTQDLRYLQLLSANLYMFVIRFCVRSPFKVDVLSRTVLLSSFWIETSQVEN